MNLGWLDLGGSFYKLIYRMEKGSREAEMLKYMNLARQFPAYFISLIDKQLQTFLNDREMPICEDVIYETNEGKKVWVEARKYLEKQSTLPPFEPHDGLNMAARDHAVDLAHNNIFGHSGSDRSTFSERILKYCKKGPGAMAQIIGADFLLADRNNAEMTVLGLIIDDGVPDRGHRKTIFNQEYRYIGCKSEVQGDKIISVFNLTENRLQIRGRSTINYNDSSSYGFSTAPIQKPQKALEKAERNNKTDHNFLASEHQQRPKREQRAVFGQVLKNHQPSATTPRENAVKGRGKRMTQKKENTRIFYEQGQKITEKVTQIYFSDGTMQENIEKHTVYTSVK